MTVASLQRCDQGVRRGGRSRRASTSSCGRARSWRCSVRTARGRPPRSRSCSDFAAPIPAGPSCSEAIHAAPNRGRRSALHRRRAVSPRRCGSARSSTSSGLISAGRRMRRTCSTGSGSRPWPGDRRAAYRAESAGASRSRWRSPAGHARSSWTSRPPGLDVESRRAVWREVRAFAASEHTVLLTTHHLEEAEALSSRVVLLARGRIVADGSAAELAAGVHGERSRGRIPCADGGRLVRLVLLHARASNARAASLSRVQRPDAGVPGALLPAVRLAASGRRSRPAARLLRRLRRARGGVLPVRRRDRRRTGVALGAVRADAARCGCGCGLPRERCRPPVRSGVRGARRRRGGLRPPTRDLSARRSLALAAALALRAHSRSRSSGSRSATGSRHAAHCRSRTCSTSCSRSSARSGRRPAQLPPSIASLSPLVPTRQFGNVLWGAAGGHLWRPRDWLLLLALDGGLRRAGRWGYRRDEGRRRYG